MSAAFSIHPAVDGGVKAGSKHFTGGVLRCKCAVQPVEVTVTAQSAHASASWASSPMTVFHRR